MPQVIERGWVSKAPRLRHVAPFDGIRGFGVIGVMAGHALPDATLSFSAIVDVFFVISGFLITTLLLQEHRDTGRVDVRKFYARRILRLLPALYVMLAGSVVVGVLVKVMGREQRETSRFAEVSDRLRTAAIRATARRSRRPESHLSKVALRINSIICKL